MTLDSAYESIIHALDNGRVAHAYLVVGALRGDAMKLAGRVLERLFPAEGGEGKMRQVSGVDVRLALHPDVHWIRPEKQSRIISVEAAREKIVAPLALTAFSGGWKAAVVVGADCFNASSANAILKTLEEPPPKTVFFLLTEQPERLLPTIVSRCQRIDLPNAGMRALEEPWRSRLLAVLASDDLVSATARAAAAGDVQGILEEFAARAEREVEEELGLAEEDGGEERSKDSVAAGIKARYREYRLQVVSTIMSWFRDLMALACSPGESTPVVNEESRRTLEARARRMTRVQAFRNVEAVEEFSRGLDRNLQEQALLSFLMDRLTYGVEAK